MCHTIPSPLAIMNKAVLHLTKRDIFLINTKIHLSIIVLWCSLTGIKKYQYYFIVVFTSWQHEHTQYKYY